MSTVTLLPCPFCGSDDIVPPESEYHPVYCRCCGLRALNVKKWNTRLEHTGGTVEAEPVALAGKAHGIECKADGPGRKVSLHFRTHADAWAFHDAIIARPSPAPAEPTEARIAELEAALRERDLLIAEMIGKAAIAVALGGGPMWERLNDEAVEARTTLAGGQS